MNDPTKRYDALFKRDAVQLLLTSGKPLKELAAELWVSDMSLRNWREPHLARLPADPEGKQLNPQQLALELRRLRRELHTANLRNEILKKAMGILSQEPLRNDMPS